MPNRRRYSSRQCGKPFKVLIDNFTKNPVKLNAQQVFATAEDRPDIITESNITHPAMLGITESDTKYRKRDKNIRDIDTVNQNLADERLAALGDENDVPITSGNVEVHTLKNSTPASAYYYKSMSIYGLENVFIFMLLLTEATLFPELDHSNKHLTVLDRNQRTKRVRNQTPTRRWRHRTLKR